MNWPSVTGRTWTQYSGRFKKRNAANTDRSNSSAATRPQWAVQPPPELPPKLKLKMSSMRRPCLPSECSHPLSPHCRLPLPNKNEMRHRVRSRQIRRDRRTSRVKVRSARRTQSSQIQYPRSEIDLDEDRRRLAITTELGSASLVMLRSEARLRSPLRPAIAEFFLPRCEPSCRSVGIVRNVARNDAGLPPTARS